MRGRQRHLNPKHAGALAAYDARFIDQADNTNVSTWASRTGTNDATQTSSTLQPKLQTNEINGQPIVDFDGSDDTLEISITIPASGTVIGVNRRLTSEVISGTFGHSATGASTRRFAYFWFNSNNGLYVGSPILTQWDGGAEVDETFTNNNSGSFVVSVTKEGSGTGSLKVYINGNQFGNARNTDASSGTFTRLGQLAAQYHSGGMGMAMLLDIAASDALRKRLQNHAGYSYKIATS